MFFTVVIFLRFAKGGFDPSYFILISQQNVESTALIQDVTVNEGGYDGQFFYRYALNPFSADVAYGQRLGNYGIKIDNARYRRARLTYPLLAWALAAGQTPLVPYTLVMVNLLAFALLVYLGREIINHYRGEPLWLYFLLFIGGFYFSTARDLADLLTCTLLAGAYLSFLKQRLLWFIIASILVLLCRESSAFYLLPAYGLWFLNGIRTIKFNDFFIKKMILFLPWIVLLVWKTVVGEMYPDDGFSTLHGLQKHFTLPFVGMISSLQYSFTTPTIPLVWSIIKSIYMLWTLLLLGICFRHTIQNEQLAITLDHAFSVEKSEQNWVVWSMWIGILLTLMYAFPIYTDPWSFMRVLAPTHLFCWLFLVAFQVKLPKWFMLYSAGLGMVAMSIVIMLR
ncbi:MAG: hypothetical protein AB8G22_04335 [Saprospiraceae bacterium]